MAASAGKGNTASNRTFVPVMDQMRAVRDAALVQFAAECNQEHARLYNEGLRQDVHQERHQTNAETLLICIQPPGLPEHPLRDDFMDCFTRLELDLSPAALFAAIGSIPATANGNERFRAIDFAVALLTKFDREPIQVRKQPKLSDARHWAVQLLDEIFTKDPNWLKIGRKSKADSLGSHPTDSGLLLGSYADLSVLLHPYHIAACMLAVVLFSVVELRSKLIPFVKWAGMTQPQMMNQIRDYEKLAGYLAARLRGMLPDELGLRGTPDWFETAERADQRDMELLLVTFRPGQHPTDHMRAANNLRLGKSRDLAPLRQQLFNDVLFLHRPVGKPAGTSAKGSRTVVADLTGVSPEMEVALKRAALLQPFRERFAGRSA